MRSAVPDSVQRGSFPLASQFCTAFITTEQSRTSAARVEAGVGARPLPGRGWQSMAMGGGYQGRLPRGWQSKGGKPSASLI